jgi:hypothetical protein
MTIPVADSASKIRRTEEIVIIIAKKSNFIIFLGANQTIKTKSINCAKLFGDVVNPWNLPSNSMENDISGYKIKKIIVVHNIIADTIFKKELMLILDLFRIIQKVIL